MSSTRSRRPRSLSKSPGARVGRSSPKHPVARDGDETSELRRVVQQQRQELEENSTNLAQALARIAHSERTLSHTKIKLLAAQEQLAAADAATASLWARFQDQEAKLSHAQADRERALAEVREQAAAERDEYAAEIASLRDALAAALERERAFRRRESEMRADVDGAHESAERIRLAEARETKALAEAVALRQSLDAVSTLAQQLVRTTEDARRAVREHEAERATLKPLAGGKEARNMRRASGPEIVVDGLPLVP